MKITDILLAPFRKAIANRPLSIRDPEHWRNAWHDLPAGEPVTGNSVLGLSAAWACVNLLSGTQASLPLMVYRTDASGARTVYREHPLYRVLHDSPNSLQTAMDFWEFVCASIELWGNAYARKVRTAVNGQVVGLMPIMPDLPAVRQLDNGLLEYRWTENNKQFVETSENILHIRGFGGNPLGGMSTLAFGARVFSLSIAIDRAAGATFRNGMRPSVAVNFKDFLKKEQRDQIEDGLAKKYTGAMNAGRPFITEGGSGIQVLQINPEDAQMLESRKFSVEEICRFFDVPPFMIGAPSTAGPYGTGLEQQTLGFQKFTLRKRLERIEQALEKQLLTPADRSAGVVIEFNLEGLLRADSVARAQVNEIYLRNKVITINEVRAQDNKPPVPWGDRPWGQMQDLQLNENGTVPSALPTPKG